MTRTAQYQMYLESPALNVPTTDIGFYLYKKSALTVAPHYHPIVEFSLVIEGSGVESVNGRTYRVEPGSATLRLPHQIHSFHADPGTVITKHGCMFDLNMIFGSPYDSAWCGRLYQVGSRYDSSVRLNESSRARVERSFQLLQEEHLGPATFGQSQIIHSGLMEALTIFLRHLGPHAVGDELAQRQKTSAFGVVIQHIHLNYTGPISLGSVAEATGLNSSYVSRLVKEQTGRNFVSYVHQLRISSAIAMLTSTEMAISDIAMEVGFESFRTFARVFRDIHGKTPGEYRSAREA